MPRLLVTVVLLGVLAAGCTGADAPPVVDGTSSDDAPTEPTSEDTATATPTGDDGTPDDGGAEEDGPALLEPTRTAGVWASTIGLPVLGAVRTSTPLARLGLLPEDEWPATCAQVAAELDTIAPPPVLTALAVTADQETATLLVGDLRAKADLLAVCEDEGDVRSELVDEVAATHEVAVAWLRAIGGQG